MADDKDREELDRIMREFGVPEAEARDILAIERGEREGDIRDYPYDGGQTEE